jgi:hypothetical protein
MIKAHPIKACINGRHGQRVKRQLDMGVLTISAFRLFSHT